MPDYPIDLGKEMGKCCCPQEMTKREEKYYPCLYLEWDDKYDLPDSGILTVRFVKTSETNRVDRDKEKSQSVSLEIHSIERVEADTKKKDEPSREEEIDKLAKRGKYSEEDED
jgi:hypothetical protein